MKAFFQKKKKDYIFDFTKCALGFRRYLRSIITKMLVIR